MQYTTMFSKNYQFAFPSGKVDLFDIRRAVSALRRRRLRLRRSRNCRTGFLPFVNNQDRRDDGESPVALGETSVGDDHHETKNTRERQRDKNCTPESGDPACIGHCTKEISLRRKARVVSRFLRTEHGLKRVHPLPPRIQCGQLRSAIRCQYPSVLDPRTELTLKTSQKLEKRACLFCASENDEKVRKWKEARSEQTEISGPHLENFKKALACNVAWGWNGKIKTVYVPNGHATENNPRKDGGNWNVEDFSRGCRVECVSSSGKPRVVTLYSSFNSEVLSPLHQSLYYSLQKESWLLVGSPTDEKVQSLNGSGQYVSVDYSSATDRLKCAYVRAAISVLKAKADPILSDDEVECLSVLGSPDFGLGPAVTGQPMGSLMSFPLLCIINKTCLDMALGDLLEQGKISCEEHRSLRCLINGDDLLFREIRPNLSLVLDRLIFHGRQVGFLLNPEKTMCHPHLAEINSTLFKDGKIQKKTNLSALFMGRDASDVVGFAADSACSVRAFSTFVLRNRSRLAQQSVKIQGPLPLPYRRALMGRKFSDALTTVPLGQRQADNLFPVVRRPAEYDLTLDEEHETIKERVRQIRARELWRSVLASRARLLALKKFGAPLAVGFQSRAKALSRLKYSDEDYVLTCLVRRWKEKRYEWLGKEAGAEPVSQLVFDGPVVFGLLDAIKAFKVRRCSTGFVQKESSQVWGDYVSFASVFAPAECG